MSDPEKKFFASVILDEAVNKVLDYEIPSHMIELASVGTRVLVPMRNSLRKATIWQLKDTSDTKNLKSIEKLLSNTPSLAPDLLKLAAWMSRYYCTPLRKVLKTLLPPSIRGETKEQKQLFVKREISLEDLAEYCKELRSSNPKQAQVVDVILKHPKGLFLSKLLEEAGVTRSPVETLVKKKWIRLDPLMIDRSPVWDQDYFLSKPKNLNTEQAEALQKIQTSLEQSQFATHLLYGVTGSGKTEVYLQAIEKALKQKKGVIFLIPEIILTSQTIERLKSRFEEKIALLHHRLSLGEKHDTWQHIKSGRAPIVIGARSAIFSPVPNLGLVIVDEEHESSYKQTDESPAYQGRDVAIMRAKFCNATVILGSATPSLESYHNALQGKYILSMLSSRPDNATLPDVHIVDMKQEYSKKKGFTLFSDKLLTALKKRLSVGEQSLLLLNRRGYHSSQVCLSCAHTLACPHCEKNLTFHLGENLLACHLCDYRLIPPRTCPSCQKDGHFKFKGAGTEMVEKALYAIFPEARVLRMDADTTRHKGSHEQLFKQFRTGKADILIGTQMIAKGLHFPAVTLVGVLNADTSLQIPDFRASETVFQLITQVAGRSGRSDLKGEVIVQTHSPDHGTILQAAKQDFSAFYEEEVGVRKLFNYPPFTHLLKLTFIGDVSEKTLEKAKEARVFLIGKLPPSFELLPVTPCGHAKVQDKYRFQFLIKTEKIASLSSLLESLQEKLNKERVRLLIDVDPLSTFF